MKIGMIAHGMSRLNGGVTEAMRRYCEALLDLGHELHVFAARDRWSDADTALFDGAQLHLANAIGPRRFPIALSLLPKMMAADLDLLHVHGIWSYHGWPALAWRRKTGRALVVSPHGMLEPWILSRSPRLKRSMSLLFQDALFKAADRVHALTDAEAGDVRKLYADADIGVVPNYVPPAPPHDGVRPGWWNPAMQGRKIFLFFGRIHEKKGVRELCDSWAHLCDGASDFADKSELIFCGWPDAFPDFEQCVHALDERFGNARYAGPQYGDDKWRAFAAADYMILPSKSEGLPMAILEAWSAQVPTIMTAECNLPIGFTAGAAIACGHDVESIAAALECAANEPDERHIQRRDAGLALVRDSFSRQRIGDGLSRLYADACEDAGHG